jgi:hypothetical protein
MRRAIIPVVLVPAGLTILYSLDGLGIEPTVHLFPLVLTGSALVSSVGLLVLLWREDGRLRAKVEATQRGLELLSRSLKSHNRA